MSGNKTEQATFGAGCFWGVEDRFRQIPGVMDAAVGYSGGKLPNPTYEDVCTNRTGHAEVVQLEYDPQKVSYETLLRTFFEMHDPTTPNRQGPDVGTQYRSVVFYHSDKQRAAVEKIKEEMGKSGRYKHPIVTAIEPAATFWRAEEYHQQYAKKHGLSCHQ